MKLKQLPSKGKELGNCEGVPAGGYGAGGSAQWVRKQGEPAPPRGQL